MTDYFVPPSDQTPTHSEHAIRGRERGAEHSASNAVHGGVDIRDPEVVPSPYDVGEWARPDPLQAPPPRPGMDQKWIWIGYGGAEDAYAYNCWSAAVDHEYWRPRKAETVADVGVPLPWAKVSQVASAHDRLAQEGYIISKGMILMERPKEIGDRRREFFRREIAKRMAALETDFHSEINAASSAGGGNPDPQRYVDTNVSLGKRA